MKALIEDFEAPHTRIAGLNPFQRIDRESRDLLPDGQVRGVPGRQMRGTWDAHFLWLIGHRDPGHPPSVTSCEKF